MGWEARQRDLWCASHTQSRAVKFTCPVSTAIMRYTGPKPRRQALLSCTQMLTRSEYTFFSLLSDCPLYMMNLQPWLVTLQPRMQFLTASPKAVGVLNSRRLPLSYIHGRRTHLAIFPFASAA